MMHASDFRKIDLVCSQDEDRPELQNVYLHEGHLYAADGFIGTRLPAYPTDKDTDGAIPAQAVAIARGANSTIMANETVRIAAKRCTFDRPEQGWPAGFERFREMLLKRSGPRPESHNPTITLDAQRMWKLARAICKDDFPGYGVEIHLGQTAHDPVLVKPYGCHDDGTLGVIMPIYLPRAYKGNEKTDPWHALARLREHIDNSAEKVCLADDLLDELRKALCVKQDQGEN